MGERWHIKGPMDEDVHEGEMVVRHIPTKPVPEWAVEFAVQRVERVTRYLCPECGDTFAVLGV